MTYVLSDFPKAEHPWLEDLARACADHGRLAGARRGPTAFQNKISSLHGRFALGG